MFLTPEELKTLTGYELAAWQRRWLDSHGYKYERASSGRPVVLRSHVNQRMSGANDDNAVVLSFDAIRRRA